jgi:hypothetical protein
MVREGRTDQRGGRSLVARQESVAQGGTARKDPALDRQAREEIKRKMIELKEEIEEHSAAGRDSLADDARERFQDLAGSLKTDL